MKMWFDEYDKILSKNRMVKGKWTSIHCYGPKMYEIRINSFLNKVIKKGNGKVVVNTIMEVYSSFTMFHETFGDAIDEYINIELYLEKKYPDLFENL